VLFDPKLGKSQEPTETAWNLAFKTDLNVWEWYELPGNEDRLRRFGMAMAVAKKAQPPTAILEGTCLSLPRISLTSPPSRI
jgi:hypothetical protein